MLQEKERAAGDQQSGKGSALETAFTLVGKGKMKTTVQYAIRDGSPRAERDGKVWEKGGISKLTKEERG